MKLLRILGVVGALALPALTPAAMTGESIRVHVPFSFVAAGREFPAGNYTIQSGENGVLYIQGAGKTVITMSVPSATSRPGTVPNLQFTRSGQKAYLVGVQNQEVIRSIPLHLSGERTLAVLSH